jgi:hypothetical protein
MEGHLEAVLEMDFCTKPPNFGVEAHMEAPTGDALKPNFFLALFTYILDLHPSPVVEIF